MSVKSHEKFNEYFFSRCTTNLGKILIKNTLVKVAGDLVPMSKSDLYGPLET